MENLSKNSTTYGTNQARSDYVADSTAKFGTAKFSKARFGKQSDFMAYGQVAKSNTTYGTNPTKN